MTRPIHLELFTDFFNKIGQEETFPSEEVQNGEALTSREYR
jgi:hypothetical protein